MTAATAKASNQKCPIHASAQPQDIGRVAARIRTVICCDRNGTVINLALIPAKADLKKSTGN